MTLRPWIALAAALTACGPSSDDPAEPYRTRGDDGCASIGGVPRNQPTPCHTIGMQPGGVIPGGVGVWAGDAVVPLREHLRTLRLGNGSLAPGELLRCDIARFPLSLTCRAGACDAAPVVLMTAYVQGVALAYVERGRVCW